MADDPASAAASSADENEEGTDSDASNNSDSAAPQGPPPLLPVTPAPHPVPAAAPEPAGPIPPPPPPSQAQDASAAASSEDSRRLFQRLWTDEEELLILRGFLEFTSRRGTAFASHQYDTGPFYEEIRRKLSFDFSKNQLIEKLRRLKKKYRVCANRMLAHGGAFAFRSAHEGAIYDVARHIWRPDFKRDDGAAGGEASDEDDINPAEAAAAVAAMAQPGAADEGGGGNTPRGRGSRRGRRRTAQEMEAPATPAAMLVTDNIAQEPAVAALETSVPLIAPPPPLPAPLPDPVTANGPTEDDFRGVLSPLLKELISSITVAGQTGLGLGLGMGFGGDILGLGFGVAGLNPVVPSGEKWRQQQILELEVYLKRIELVREQVTTVLEELRSSES